MNLLQGIALYTAHGIFLAALQRARFSDTFGSQTHSCRCANDVRVTDGMLRYCAAPPGGLSCAGQCRGAPTFRLKERSGARRPYGVKAPRRRYAPPHRAIGNGDTDSHIMYGTMSRALYLITAA
ncbi:hypothetical protein HMPREF9555_01448 [Selenomonas artemidis F0399]|uniref:Uncharacterized protein n=1 Tax=Selenomonas artemidis F0399 TaxID=749551 RepID=E7N374_9FIRM|nr:hypothetical protein HMPREF9555_01448 [Selenomonas artemidis F0399]